MDERWTPERVAPLAEALRSLLTQDQLRVLSYAVYRSVTSGRMRPVELALLRPVLAAFPLAIDAPERGRDEGSGQITAAEPDDDRPGRWPGPAPWKLRAEPREPG